MTKETRTGGLVKLGNDDVRIEQGPMLKRGVATKELLSNDKTADHYQLGGPDAFGKPIVEGSQFDYLDWGGSTTEGEKVFYVYHKVPVDHTAETLKDGEPNPYFVPEHARQNPDGKTRAFYEYVFIEVGTRPTEDEAQKLAETTLAKLPAMEKRSLPKSHLAHIARAAA